MIGPEVLLAEDYATSFRKNGFLVVGPGKVGAQLETSKIFAKEFMMRAKVPTAAFKIYQNWEEFQMGVTSGAYPKVLKLDGLAAGKGVVIAKVAEDAFWGGRSGYFRDPDGYLWEVAWNPDFPHV